MGTPMEGFFDGADVVAEAMASTTSTTAQGVPVETPILSTKSVPVDKGTHIERVSKLTPITTETLTPQKGVAPPVASQTEVASPATPPVISTGNLFVALS